MAEWVQQRLFALRDEKYRAFQCSLMPTVPKERVIGVRMPRLRALAKELNAFPGELPHRYYEEDNLHALHINAMEDYAEAVDALDAFLPWVDNWATCDLLRPRAFRDHPPELEGKIAQWLASDHPYTQRFAAEMLMVYYLEEGFSPEHPARVAALPCGEYYVDMMVAWYFATALAKQYDAVLPWLQEKRLTAWRHNKTIQKAVESCRITPEQKDCLRTLRIK